MTSRPGPGLQLATSRKSDRIPQAEQSDGRDPWMPQGSETEGPIGCPSDHFHPKTSLSPL
jgi:hypothetical protein